jgi:hypothetical protein
MCTNPSTSVPGKQVLMYQYSNTMCTLMMFEEFREGSKRYGLKPKSENQSIRIILSTYLTFIEMHLCENQEGIIEPLSYTFCYTFIFDIFIHDRFRNEIE